MKAHKQSLTWVIGIRTEIRILGNHLYYYGDMFLTHDKKAHCKTNQTTDVRSFGLVTMQEHPAQHKYSLMHTLSKIDHNSLDLADLSVGSH